MHIYTKLLISLTALFFLMAPATAMAKGSDQIDIDISSIYAAKTGEGFSSELDALKGQLTRGFSGYSTFKQLAHTTKHLSLGETGRASLVSGLEASFTFVEGDSKNVKLKFSIPDKVSTTLVLTRGTTFFQAGINHNDGILIFAIEVN